MTPHEHEHDHDAPGPPGASSRGDDHDHEQGHDHGHDHGHGHGASHTHGLVDREILRSRAAIRAVLWSLAVLGVTAGLQAGVLATVASVALFAELVHNFGDALTAVPLGIAFRVRSARAERIAGVCVVLVIAVSATLAGVEAVDRLVHPQAPTHLWVLAAAGVVGVVGNLTAARIRTRAGERLHAASLVADGHHARADALVSLGVVASAGLSAFGIDRADPVIGLVITAVLFRVSWQSWVTVRDGDHGPARPVDPD